MKEKEEILTFEIDITGVEEVKGKTGEAAMVTFTGNADCNLFKGIVLPGGVDIQKKCYGSFNTLSARYILEGTDKTGKECRIFVENNGTFDENGVKTTVPKIFTDSEALSFLETADLIGTLAPRHNGVTIHIFLA